jgi:hypothetical protein
MALAELPYGRICFILMILLSLGKNQELSSGMLGLDENKYRMK